jgi:hypothetical protein
LPDVESRASVSASVVQSYEPVPITSSCLHEAPPVDENGVVRG